MLTWCLRKKTSLPGCGSANRRRPFFWKFFLTRNAFEFRFNILLYITFVIVPVDIWIGYSIACSTSLEQELALCWCF